MVFGRRRRGQQDAGLQAADCEHVWRARNVTGALTGAAYRVCDRCGAVRVDDLGDEAAPTPDAVVSPPAGDPAGHGGTVIELPTGATVDLPPAPEPEWHPQHAAGGARARGR